MDKIREVYFKYKQILEEKGKRSASQYLKTALPNLSHKDRVKCLYKAIHGDIPKCPYCDKEIRVNSPDELNSTCGSKSCTVKYNHNKTNEYIDKNSLIALIKSIGLNNGFYRSIEKYKDCIKEYTGVDNVKEGCYLLYHDMNEPPKCIYCGNKCGFISVVKGYKETCNGSCAVKHGIKRVDQNKAYLKRKETVKKKYGVDHVKKLPFKNKHEIENITKDFVLDRFTVDGTPETVDVVGLAGYFNCSIDYIRNKLRDIGCAVPRKVYRSTEEDELYRWVINQTDKVVIPNYRKGLSSYEIDVFVPELNFGIEYDGIYWHSTKNQTDPNKHHKKATLCHEKGIRLFQIYDIEWKDDIKRAIWQSMIKNALGLAERRIYARKCVIKEIDTKTAKEFINNNHLQGYASSVVKLGLYHDDELVAVATFSKSRFKAGEDELIRFCNKLNTVVVGGFSKLINHYVKVYNPDVLVSYANRRWSNGNVYENCGFEFEHITQAGYYYTDGHKLYSRQRFQKHKLKEMFDKGLITVYNDDMSEKEIMESNGFWRVYDAGHIKYVLRK